jgi:nicotinamidase-related amidase
MTNPLLIDSSKSALLVMDYQIDILERFMAPADPIEVLSVLPKLLAAARSAGMLVIYVVASFRPGYPEISPRNPIFSGLAQNGLLQAGSPGTQIHRAVASIEGEPIVVKHRVGAFSGTDLQTILQSKAIETLVLTGVSTSVVVLSTLRQAFDLDYRILVAGDCCADPDREVHDMLLSRVFPRQATVTSAALLCDAIRTCPCRSEMKGKRLCPALKSPSRPATDFARRRSFPLRRGRGLGPPSSSSWMVSASARSCGRWASVWRMVAIWCCCPISITAAAAILR